MKSDFEKELLGMQGNMLSFAYMLTSNRDDAYDLVQDATLKALDNSDKYVENTNFKAWVMTIMRNIFINNYRRSGRTTTIEEEDGNKTSLLETPTTEQSHETPEGSIALDDINSALSTLSDIYRESFAMYLACYKYEEISEIFNLPLGTIKSRIFMARKQLQEILKDYK